MLAAVISQPERAAEKQASFLRVGYEIADGKNLWPTPPRIPSTVRPALKKK
jgi:hypothetical protein